MADEEGIGLAAKLFVSEFGSRDKLVDVTITSPEVTSGRLRLGLGSVGSEVGREAERISHRIAALLLRWVLASVQNIVRRQVQHTPCLAVKCRPDLVPGQHISFVLIRQLLGPRRRVLSSAKAHYAKGQDGTGMVGF